MRAIAGGAQRGPLISTAVLIGSLIVLAFAVLQEAQIKEVTLVSAVLALAAIALRSAVPWHFLVAALVVLVLFIPIKRYALPWNVPIDLEPYRLAIGVLLLIWLSSLLIDPRVRLRPTGLEGPFLAIAAAVLLSDLINPGRVNAVGSYVVKDLTFFASFVLVVYFVASVVRTREALDTILKTLVGGATVLVLFALIERRTHYNVFDHLGEVVPFLHLEYGAEQGLFAPGRLRVWASAQHPIALGAAFAILVPYGLYLAKAMSRIWWIAVILLVIGTLATAARTAVVMLVVVGVVLLILRGREVARLWPAALPLVLLVHFAAPGTIGTLRTIFEPNALIAEQRTVVLGNEALANNRLADLGPAFQEASNTPVFGQGFGTRVTGFDAPFINAAILDNQWLVILLEMGIIGLLAWAWLFGRVARRLGTVARADPSPRGWLPTALAASATAFAVGMFTFDAFSFIQVTVLFFILLGLGGSLTYLPDRAEKPEVGTA